MHLLWAYKDFILFDLDFISFLWHLVDAYSTFRGRRSDDDVFKFIRSFVALKLFISVQIVRKMHKITGLV